MSTSANIAATSPLRHSSAHAVGLVCLGNPLRTDDAVASAVAACLPIGLKQTICLLDAGAYTADIPAFLQGHQVGIIVDACQAGSGDDPHTCELQPGAKTSSVAIDCCHGLSCFDELTLYKKILPLPSRLLLFAIPVRNTTWSQGLSPEMQERLPYLTDELTRLLIEELKTCTKRQ